MQVQLPYTIQQIAAFNDSELRDIAAVTRLNFSVIKSLTHPIIISDTMFTYLVKFGSLVSVGTPFSIASVEHILTRSNIVAVVITSIEGTLYTFNLNSNQATLFWQLFERRGSTYRPRYLLIEQFLKQKSLTLKPLTDEEAKSNFITKAFHYEENSNSFDILENTSRFSGATWFEAIQEKTIILAGLGGIGSYVCYLLSRVRPKSLFLYDNDIVEPANMSGQLYSKNDCGQYKTQAISNMINQYSDYLSVFASNERYTSDNEASDIMICGFDNMEARRVFFENWKQHVLGMDDSQKKNCLLIDGRLAAEYLQIFCLTGDDIKAIEDYEKNQLFIDSIADSTQCSYKQTSYMANMIGSLIVNLFTNFVANEVAQAPVRDLPYLTIYDGSSMQLKLKYSE